MVTGLLAQALDGATGLLGQQSPAADAPAHVLKFKMVAMLLLLVLGGVALVFFSWLYLRAGRRALSRSDARFSRRRELDRDDWARKAADLPTAAREHRSPEMDAEG